MPQKIKALLIFEQCNPEWPSFSLSAYGLFRHISAHVDVTLVTHIRNRENLEKVREPGDEIVYIEEPSYLSKYWRFIEFLTRGRGTNWPLLHALSYPIYADFNRRVYRQFAERVKAGDFDLVHACSPVLPRYPVKLSEACEKTPFILGPVNGGLPYPKGFGSIAFQEFAHFNFLRLLAPFIPGYKKTYRRADTILVGNTPTIDAIQKATHCKKEQCYLFFENGITDKFLHKKELGVNELKTINLLYLGRLVAYKGSDMLIESLALLDKEILKRIKVTLVGEGPMMPKLKELVQRLNLDENVEFIGNVPHAEAPKYYRAADIFCSPSVREFGGTVIMEAFGHSLPCIVVNHGGPTEYITDECGFRIDPIDRRHIIEQIAVKVQLLATDPELYKSMSEAAYRRAQCFIWENKAKELLEIYENAIASKNSK